MRIAVIGAGISGLSCAYTLQKKGVEVVVFEKDDHVGGRMVTRVKNDLPFDIGVDHLCNHYHSMRSFCDELGLKWEKMRFLKYGVLRDGKIYGPDEVVGRISKLRLAFQYFLVPRGLEFLDLNTAVKYDVDNAYDALLGWIGQEATDYLVDGFCSSYEFHRSSEISLGALYAIMYSIKHDNEEWYLHRIRGGMSALPEALAKKLDVRTDTAVFGVRTSDQVASKKIVQTNDGEELFDRVVMACTASATRRILLDLTDEQLHMLDAVRYASTIGLSFMVDEELLPETTIIWVPYVEGGKISSYSNQRMKGGEYVHERKSLVSVWLHEDYARTLMEKSDEEIFIAVAGEFLKVCPWFTGLAQLIPHDLQRWEEAEPKFYEGYLTLVKEFLDRYQGQNGVYFTGDYLNAPWSEGAIRRGIEVAESCAEF